MLLGVLTAPLAKANQEKAVATEISATKSADLRVFRFPKLSGASSLEIEGVNDQVKMGVYLL